MYIHIYIHIHTHTQKYPLEWPELLFFGAWLPMGCRLSGTSDVDPLPRSETSNGIDLKAQSSPLIMRRGHIPWSITRSQGLSSRFLVLKIDFRNLGLSEGGFAKVEFTLRRILTP